MSVHKTIAADLRLAYECLQDAGVLLQRNSRNSAYLCSQAAEHLVRAVSTAEGLHIERSHAHLIDTNIRRFPDENTDKAAFLQISALEIYSTTYRYPTAAGRITPPPPPDDLRQKLALIEDLLTILLRHFGVDLSTDKPATKINPRRRVAQPGDV